MAVDGDLLLVIKSNGLGEGEPDLGEKLLTGFLNKLLESDRLPAKMIFMNSGVFLTTAGSSVIETLQKFGEQGTAFSTCGTCLTYFDRADKLLIGEVGNMADTVNAMLSFKKVLVP